MTQLLQVEDLVTEFPRRNGAPVRAVDRVSFSVARGETLGIVGESGSGKSVLIRSVLRILDAPGRVASGRVLFHGEDILALPEARMRQLRGSKIAMIFQNPAGSLNPVIPVGRQMIEAIRAHERVSPRAARTRAIETLTRTGVTGAEALLAARPFELSGGVIQRLMIAMALSCGPDLLLADEPTTSLDVTVQEKVIGALRQVQKDFGTAIIFISHDMGAISEISDRIMVMYGGRAVEQGGLVDILTAPRHPYSDGLIRSVPSAGVKPGDRLSAIPGYPPDLSRLPAGCRFAARCDYADAACAARDPDLARISAGRAVACHHPLPAPVATVGRHG